MNIFWPKFDLISVTRFISFDLFWFSNDKVQKGFFSPCNASYFDCCRRSCTLKRERLLLFAIICHHLLSLLLSFAIVGAIFVFPNIESPILNIYFTNILPWHHKHKHSLQHHRSSSWSPIWPITFYMVAPLLNSPTPDSHGLPWKELLRHFSWSPLLILEHMTSHWMELMTSHWLEQDIWDNFLQLWQF